MFKYAAGRDLESVIECRLLITYRVDPVVLAERLPSPFRPQTVHGWGVAGVCMIRLGRTRPSGMPSFVGAGSESAAHRIAAEWDTPEGVRTGVWIPRRDSASRLNVLLGGRLFPGAHHRADFEVHETPGAVRVAFAARDGSAAVEASVELADRLDGSELFADLAEASAFFRGGCAGYSATRDPGRFDGMELDTSAWQVSAGHARAVRSSWCDAFPAGSATLDNTLVMRDVPVTWRSLPPLRAAPTRGRVGV